MIVVKSCGKNEAVMAAVDRFLTHELENISSLESLIFDCNNNLCLLAFLRLNELCHKTYKWKRKESIRNLCL